MNTIDKKTILLIGHNNYQEWALTLTLKLGGYNPHVVKDEDEAINMVKALPEAIHSLILPGTGFNSVLRSLLEVFSRNRIDTPVCLLGGSAHELDITKALENTNIQLRLFSCGNDQLLEHLSQY